MSYVETKTLASRGQLDCKACEAQRARELDQGELGIATESDRVLERNGRRKEQEREVEPHQRTDDHRHPDSAGDHKQWPPRRRDGHRRCQG